MTGSTGQGVRHVLTLAYHFPPIGGAGSQRNAQLARRLPALGWRQTILTGPGSVDYRWTPLDETLTSEHHVHEILRLPATEPARVDRRTALAERWLRRTTPWTRWWRESVLRAAHDVESDVEVVHASVAPYQTAEAAIDVARALDLPLVLDLEDPWALDEMLVYPSALHRRLELRRMRATLRAADRVVMNTPEAARRVCACFPEAIGRTVAVPNAYDAADFATPVATQSDGIFRLLHAGSLHTELGWEQRRKGRLRRLTGGAVPGVDFLARSLVYVLQAIDRVLEQCPDLHPRLEFHVAGVLTPADHRALEGKSYIRLHGFLTHTEVVTLMRSADLLFLPLYGLADGDRAGLIPQKTYEYLASGRPILAAVPAGDARDLLESAQTATVCPPTGVAEMARAMLAEIARFDRGEAPACVDSALLQRCESSRMATDLAAVFEAALQGRR